MGNIEETCLIVKDNSVFSSWPEICWARVGTLRVFKNHSIEKYRDWRSLKIKLKSFLSLWVNSHTLSGRVSAVDILLFILGSTKLCSMTSEDTDPWKPRQPFGQLGVGRDVVMWERPLIW